jgi:3-hydroxyisobutyrate dehydrogenase
MATPDSTPNKRLDDIRVLFIGLGQIGVHLASHLVSDGADVIAFNRHAEKAISWAGRTGGSYTTDPAAAVASRNVVVTCVGNDEDLAEVFTPKFVRAIPAKALVIDHTTASATGARALAAKLAEHDVSFVDAPVSGGSTGAANRKLSVMVGTNDDQIFLSAEQIMRSYAARIVRVGTVGAGQLCKMANQVCIAGALQGVAEALGLAIRAGLDPGVVVEALGGGAANSWQLQNRSSFMIERKYPGGFSARLMLKDLELALAEASRRGVEVSVAGVARDRYASLVTAGLGEEDFANIFRLVADEM